MPSDISIFVALIMRSNPFDPVDKVSSLYWEPITRTVNCLLCAGEADLCPSHCVWSKSQNSPQDLFPALVGGGSCIKRKKRPGWKRQFNQTCRDWCFQQEDSLKKKSAPDKLFVVCASWACIYQVRASQQANMDSWQLSNIERAIA